ncbi:hypothetical protein MOC12_20825 [Bacillus spizizenii]|nr:hypothetical protein [Bacillus spizizenii]
MKKALFGIGTGLLAIGLLSGCTSQDQIVFEGKRMTTDRAEDILESRLKKENRKAYDVDIALESKSSKKKRKRGRR